MAANAVTEITRKFKNPNGCKINAAFYTTSSLSDCKTVKALWKIGHEIAEHTVNHDSLAKMSSAKKKKEILGARDWINKCGIPLANIAGHRSPYLEDDPEVRSILKDAGYLYDSSITEVYDSPTSPSYDKRLFPYSFDKGNPQVYSCKWFDNINHCTKDEKHVGLMEVPMWYYQKKSDSGSAGDIMDPKNPYDILKAEFDRNYAAHRAPVGIWTHTSTGYLTKQ